jgi:septal ring factor EnvC (AmiA/AmiB activator)
MYYETKYSLPMFLQLHNILKDKRITKDKDILELVELVKYSLPENRNRFEELLNQVAALENEKASLNTEIMGLRNPIYTNNEVIRKQNMRIQTLERKRRVLEAMLQNANKDVDYNKVVKMVDQRLNDRIE